MLGESNQPHGNAHPRSLPHDAKPYTLKPVVKPLPSSQERPANEPRFRDITEDDDGYHPYADVPDTRPLFEENPWD